MNTLTAVMGKMPHVHLTAGQASHLTENGATTLCGLLVRNRIAHTNHIRNVVSCKTCTRKADREFAGWRS